MLHQLEFYLLYLEGLFYSRKSGHVCDFSENQQKKKGKKNNNKKRAKYLKIWANMYKIWKYFKKGRVIVCDYHTQ